MGDCTGIELHCRRIAIGVRRRVLPGASVVTRGERMYCFEHCRGRHAVDRGVVEFDEKGKRALGQSRNAVQAFDHVDFP